MEKTKQIHINGICICKLTVYSLMPLSEYEIIDAEAGLTEIIDEYIQEHATDFAKKDWIEVFVEGLYKYITDLFDSCGIWEDPDDEELRLEKHEDLQDYIRKYFLETCQLFEIPMRENGHYHTDDTTTLTRDNYRELLKTIHNYPVQTQRTMEWYMARQELFSASNLWKLFSTPAQYNSLIYEKCKPLDIGKMRDGGDILMPNARNWGIKYEPVTVMIYEDKFKTRVNTHYGCIPHRTLPVGASPDGIVCDESSEKYGRMVEIKNIYNREIDGIPSEEYWTQMQVQMEVCNLPLCDFVETRFKEYNTQTEYLEDQTHEYKGLILCFIPRNPVTHHTELEYSPLGLDAYDESIWIQTQQELCVDTHLLYTTQYWYLDEFSCTEVERNMVWFQSVIPHIQSSWETVKKEREEGYSHRAPQSRDKPATVVPNPANPVPSTMGHPMHIQVVKLDSDQSSNAP